jgi:hypothetical protein
VAGGTKRAITREGDWKVRLNETAAVEGNLLGWEFVEEKKRRPCLIRDSDGMQRRPVVVAAAKRPSGIIEMRV